MSRREPIHPGTGKLLPWASAWLLAAGLAMAAAAEPSPNRLAFEPSLFTALDGQEIAAEQGRLTVPEDRSRPEARSIELALVRFPAVTPRPGPPVVYLAGGPGSSGIDSARGSRLPLLLALREIGDVIALDQRGTGSSAPSLICQESWTHPRDQPLDPERTLTVIRERARSCAEMLEQQGTNLSAYNANAIADDLEDLRQALGVPQISLLATSYGTHLALAAIRRHEASIHRAVLMGVVGPDHTLKLPATIQRRLEELGRLNGYPETESGAPTFPAAVETVLARLAEEPVTVKAIDPLAGQEVELRVGKFDLQLATIQALGNDHSAARLPSAYRLMLDGDFSSLAPAMLKARKGWLGRAMPYAVICASGASDERWRAVTEQETRTALGRWLDFPFPDVCQSWGVPDLGPEFRSPLSSQVPVLLISGSHDVRTPPENADEVLKGFPRGHHLVVEGAGHGDDLLLSSPGLGEQISRFLQGQALSAERAQALPLWERLSPPPATRAESFSESLHGVEVADPYRWLEDPSPDTRLWIELQNRHADAVLGILPGRDRLRQHLSSLLRVDAIGLPWVRGGRYFFSRRRADQELAVIVMREGEQGEDQVLIDPHPLSGDESLSVRILDVSDDGRWLVYGAQKGGEDEIEVRLFDVARRQTLAERLPRARYFGVSLTSGGQGMYYSREGSKGARIAFHRLGTDPATDLEIFGEGYGRGTVLWANLSDDGRYLVIHVFNTTRKSEVYVQNLAAGGEILKVVDDLPETFYGGVLGDQLVLHTQWDAPRGRVLVADPDHPDRARWREIIPEHETAVIQSVFGAGGKLFVTYLEGSRTQVRLFDLAGHELGEIPLPAVGTLNGIRGQWHRNEIYLAFSSFHIPPTVYRYDAAQGRSEVWARAGAPIDSEKFESRQVWYRSQDGTSVPMIVIYPKDVKLDGSRPTLLTGYGGFGTSLTPSFNEETAAWIDRGGVYAIANVRGGGELGEQWHQAAVREKKQSSFDDFIAAAEWLIAEGYTRPEKLAISGHSNGGLLVAAAMTQRPELFRAVICSHPVLDMLRYNKFTAGKFWLPEYGSPDMPDAFKYLYAYSPYHRIDRGKEYPAVLFVTGEGDTRVAPLHARKMTARMQASATAERPVLLRYHAQAGHSGAGISRSLRIEELTDTLSFLFWQLGEL